MTVSLVCPQRIIDEILQAAALEVETAGVLIASIVETPDGDLRILARQMRWVHEDAYIRREVDSLAIASEGYVHVLAEAEELNAACLWVHTHPGIDAWPKPSCHDRIVDDQLADLFRLRSASPYYGALIFSPRPGGLTFTGHLERDTGPNVKIERLWQVGDRWRLTPAFEASRVHPQSIFDRNIRAFGPNIQSTLGDLRVGIVGCGGTGSAVGEQLVRLGVRHFTLIDPDVLSESNTTRVYGSTPDSVGRLKTEILGKHLQQIAHATQIKTVNAMVTLETTARQLTACDIVYGCTDDNAGRLVLSRAATYLLMPVIDCGVLLSSDGAGMLVGIDGRVTTLVPGQACLVCRNRIDIARAGSELLTPEERVRRVDEGYAPALTQTEPAVVAYTTLVAATAVSELLERLIGYGPEPRPSEVLLRYHEREMSTNIAFPRERHYCHPASGKLGAGITTPFLEQAWP
jgi:molybdopterin/thiamine biosynthesis adenylyltransferase/proteasome lid subunit RPN8/RPN11